MIIRKTTEADFVGISSLYKECFNLDATLNGYNHWYLFDGDYTSMVCELDGKIVAHNAFMVNRHTHLNQSILVALSSGGMVSPTTKTPPGLFYKMIQECKKHLPNDIIIAFPNKNAELTWVRLLKYNVVEDHYLSLVPEKFNGEVIMSEFEFQIQRSQSFLNHRLDQHPRNTFIKYESGNFVAYTKLYNQQTELVYASSFGKEFVEYLKYLFNHGASQINIISRYKEPLQKIGFEIREYNKFVYQWTNPEMESLLFDCQMVDSDVF